MLFSLHIKHFKFFVLNERKIILLISFTYLHRYFFLAKANSRNEVEVEFLKLEFHSCPKKDAFSNDPM